MSSKAKCVRLFNEVTHKGGTLCILPKSNGTALLLIFIVVCLF